MNEILTAIIFIGIQGSGKTYYYENYLKDGYVHINLDTLHTRNKEWNAIVECVENSENMVIDNTNPRKEDRARYISFLKDAGYRVVGYFFESRIQDCVQRNEGRVGKAKVPRTAIAATSNKLEMPRYSEGFDALYFVGRTDQDAFYQAEWRNEHEVW